MNKDKLEITTFLPVMTFGIQLSDGVNSSWSLSVSWLAPQPATTAPGRFRVDCGIQHRTSPLPPFSGQRRVPASTRIHTAQVMAQVPGPPHLKGSQVLGSGHAEAWQQARPSSGSHFLEARLPPPLKGKERRIQADRRLANYLFFLPQFGSTLSRR